MSFLAPTSGAGPLASRWPWRRVRVYSICVLALLAISREAPPAFDLFPTAPEELRLSNDRTALFLPHRRDVPLLIFLHSGGGRARTALVESGFAAAARRAGVSLAFGESVDGLWRYEGLRGVAAPRDPRLDEAYLLELRAALTARGYGTAGVFLVGYSNGGMVALQAACRHPEEFQGVALISSAMPAAVGESCPSLPARVVAVNGEADPVMPVAGGEGVNGQIGPLWSLERLGDALMRRRDCAGFESAPLDSAPQVVLAHAIGCERAGVTELYRVVAGGHEGYGDENWRPFGGGPSFAAPGTIIRAFAMPQAEARRD